ncbi:MAG: anthranilate synthase component I [Candidatus Omnitrophica bacterium]|nr:anthranilate synthase component I [Candidatus Omnitrophota bacterium]
MISPSISELKKNKLGTIVPVYKEILADMETPVSVFLKISRHEANAALLESVELGEQLGRYSFICFGFKRIISSDGHSIFAEEKGKTKKKISAIGDILHLIEPEIKEKSSRFKRSPKLPTFQGGYVGYLSYENVRYFETIKLDEKKKGLNVPESVFFYTDHFIVFDHVDRKLRIVKLVECGPKLRENYRIALKEIESTQRIVKGPLPTARKKPVPEHFQFKSNVPRATFLNQVRRIKEYIRAGDCIQVVLSQRFDIGKVHDDFAIYRVLRSINPSPYMFYFRYGKSRLIGSSPELLVKKTSREAEVRPIAGTRPRGLDKTEDLQFERDLKNSKKELAEHLMLVDLGRNDLGRIAKIGSVRVKNFARVERYSHVMHMVSDVVGILDPNRTAIELLRVSFPAGTVSGAPKIRAMQIIDELEKEKRGPYAGSVGYFSLTGDMDMCIAIRTVVSQNGHAYVQAGAGIVNDSNPKREYDETMNKAKALIQAVQISKGNELL